MIQRTQETLLKRLRDYLPGDIEVIPLPDNRKELERPFEHGQIVLVFAGAKSSDPKTSGGAGQVMTQSWQLVLRHRRLSGNGLYGMIDAVRLLFGGWRPAGMARPMIHIGESPPEILDAVWTAFMSFSAEGMIGPLPEPENLPALIDATFENAPHNHTTTVEKTP